MFLLSALTILAAVSSPAAAQPSEEITIAAACDSGGSYGVRGGPVQGWIIRFGREYSIDLFLPPTATRAGVGALRENDRATGWIHLDVNSPTLDLADPAVRLDLLSIQGPPVLAEESAATWRVRLTVGDDTDWYGPGGVGEPVFTYTSYTVDQPYGAEPYVGFFDRGDERVGLEVYRRVIAEGRLVAEFHTPGRFLRSGDLFAVSEFSLEPLGPFLQAAQAHFDQCDARGGD